MKWKGRQGSNNVEDNRNKSVYASTGNGFVRSGSRYGKDMVAKEKMGVPSRDAFESAANRAADDAVEAEEKRKVYSTRVTPRSNNGRPR